MKTTSPLFWTVLAGLCLTLAGVAGAAENERTGDIQRPAREAPPRANADRAALDRLRAQVKELEAANKLEEAEMVKKRIAELEREARPAPLMPRRDLADMEERIRLMDEEIKELRRLGENGEADRLERERNGIKDKLVQAREQGDFRRPTPMREGQRFDTPIEPERRMQHLRVAIENLRAAGLPDEAVRLERLARQMQPGQEGQPPGEMRPGQPAGMNQERMDRMEADLRELRQMVRELQRQLR